MSDPDLESALSDSSHGEPSRSVARALIYGCLAGVGAALAALLTVAGGFDFPLIDALLAGEIGEFFAGLLYWQSLSRLQFWLGCSWPCPPLSLLSQ